MRQRAETGRGEESEKMEERREGAPERTPAAEKTEKNHEPSGDVISIVVPVYNGEACLMRCIRSLQEQSYPNLDIVLVDDGSRDKSLEICRAAAEKDARIQVIHKENGGVASARNAGIAAARGRWLMLIDGDDYIHRDMAADLLTASKKSGAQAAVCGFERVLLTVRLWRSTP